MQFYLHFVFWLCFYFSSFFFFLYTEKKNNFQSDSTAPKPLTIKIENYYRNLFSSWKILQMCLFFYYLFSCKIEKFIHVEAVSGLKNHTYSCSIVVDFSRFSKPAILIFKSKFPSIFGIELFFQFLQFKRGQKFIVRAPQYKLKMI